MYNGSSQFPLNMLVVLNETMYIVNECIFRILVQNSTLARYFIVHFNLCHALPEWHQTELVSTERETSICPTVAQARRTLKNDHVASQTFGAQTEVASRKLHK